MFFCKAKVGIKNTFLSIFLRIIDRAVLEFPDFRIGVVHKKNYFNKFNV
jgi:hypothetical protein